MALNAKHLLCKLVSNAQTISDIIPLLHCIPLEAIQDAMLDVIRGLDTNTINDIQYKCLSITDIVPDDIMQHIVSFTDSLNLKYINKTFNSCYNKNKALTLKQRQQIIEQHALNPTVKYEENNNTWVIHPKRSHLNREEIASGYKGPINELLDAMFTVQSGDKLLFYDGNYVETDDECEFSPLLTNDLQFIGIGHDVCLKMAKHSKIELCDGQSVYFKNVKIEMGDPFHIEGNSKVSMEDCEIVMGASINVSDGTFNAKNCIFSGPCEGEARVHYPINMECGSNVNIIGCTFTNHRQTCIWLHDKHIEKYVEDVEDDAFLTCVGNIFKNNFGYPIAMERSSGQNFSIKLTQFEKSVIRNNILEGYNGAYVNVAVDTANKIYVDSHDRVRRLKP
eukprot:946325_1